MKCGKGENEMGEIGNPYAHEKPPPASRLTNSRASRNVYMNIMRIGSPPCIAVIFHVLGSSRVKRIDRIAFRDGHGYMYGMCVWGEWRRA